MKRTAFVLLVVFLVAGCVSYPGAIDRQLEKENAAIAAQVESCNE